MTIRSEDGTAP